MTTHTAGGPAVSLELRCPDDMAKLLGKVRPAITDGMVELACSNCRRAARAKGVDAVVLHRFNLLAELIETEIVYATPERLTPACVNTIHQEEASP